MRLGLLGKKYNDTKIVTSGLTLNETNECLPVTHSMGGMYNIASADIGEITPICYVEGEKDALILQDTENSTRTSLVSNSKEYPIKTVRQVSTRHPDWIHVMYADDIKSVHRVSEYHEYYDPSIKFPCSLDFCTDTTRDRYEPLMRRCELVFDSRERKHLYEKMSIATPIVLHDPSGCEVMLIGYTSYKFDIKPLKNLQVNGAGDIFAAYFIREYYQSNLKTAVENACTLTTEYLVRRSNNG